MTSARTKNGFLSRKSLFVLFILLIFIINFFVYPQADKLKYQGRGSDQDDSLIAASSALVKGENPYLIKIPYYPSNPISPGPGWISLNIPFAATGFYFLLTPFYLLLLTLLLKKLTEGFYLSNLFILLCMSSFAFWETMVVGSDMFAVGALLTLCVYLFHVYLYKNIFLLFISAILLGFAATSRIIFIYCIGLIGLLFWRKYGLRSIIYSTISLVTALLLHAIFYFWNPNKYSVFHVVAKNSMLFSPAFKLLGLFSILGVLFFTYRNTIDRLGSRMFFFWLCLVVPLIFASMGDLITLRKFDFSIWEGANYLIVALPVFLIFICINLSNYEKV